MKCILMLLVALAGCVPAASFAPYRAQYASGAPPIVKRAVVAYEGDIEPLTAAGAVLVGWLDGYAHPGRDPRKEAARVGGTHVVLVRSSTHTFIVGMHCTSNGTSRTSASYTERTTATVAENSVHGSTSGVGNAVTTASSSSDCAQESVTTTSTRHAVMRLEPDHWEGIVAALRPMKGIPPALSGCTCTSWGPYGAAPSESAYLECPGEDQERLASDEEYELLCEEGV